MSEQLIRTEPFENKADAILFSTEVMERMRTDGFIAEPIRFGDITVDIINLIIEDDAMGKVYGNVRIIIKDGQMAVAADGNNWAPNAMTAVARGLGLSEEEAIDLIESATMTETRRGYPILIAVLPKSEESEPVYISN
mgnify:CR=1 FL=1